MKFYRLGKLTIECSFTFDWLEPLLIHEVGGLAQIRITGCEQELCLEIPDVYGDYLRVNFEKDGTVLLAHVAYPLIRCAVRVRLPGEIMICAMPTDFRTNPFSKRF